VGNNEALRDGKCDKKVESNGLEGWQWSQQSVICRKTGTGNGKIGLTMAQEEYKIVL
jgi:hypothetical protein